MLSLLRRSRAFTLIELLVVVLMVGLLIAVALPNFLGQKDKAYDADAKHNLAVAYHAGKPLWQANDNRYPVAGVAGDEKAVGSLIGLLTPTEPEMRFVDDSIGVTSKRSTQIQVTRPARDVAIYVDMSKSGRIWCLEAVERPTTSPVDGSVIAPGLYYAYGTGALACGAQDGTPGGVEGGTPHNEPNTPPVEGDHPLPFPLPNPIGIDRDLPVPSPTPSATPTATPTATVPATPADYDPGLILQGPASASYPMMFQTVESDGANPMARVTGVPFQAVTLRYDHTGQRVLFMSEEPANMATGYPYMQRDLYAHTLGTGLNENLTNTPQYGEHSMATSRGTDKIVYVKDDTGCQIHYEDGCGHRFRGAQVWVMNGDGSNAHSITGEAELVLDSNGDRQGAWPEGNPDMDQASNPYLMRNWDNQKPAISPDGTKVAWVHRTSTNGWGSMAPANRDWHVIVADIDGSNRQVVLTEAGDTSEEPMHDTPSWRNLSFSQDGSKLAISRGDAMATSFVVVNADGSGGPATISFQGDEVLYSTAEPQWGADGRLYAGLVDLNTFDINLVSFSAGGGDRRTEVPYGVLQSMSSNGSRYVYADFITGNMKSVYLDGSQERTVGPVDDYLTGTFWR